VYYIPLIEQGLPATTTARCVATELRRKITMRGENNNHRLVHYHRTRHHADQLSVRTALYPFSTALRYDADQCDANYFRR
jgi:hypothetical protein